MFQGSYHTLIIWAMLGFYRLPQWLSGKESLAVQETQEMQVWSLGQEILWRRKWQPTPVFLPGEPHGQRRLAGYSPKGHKKSDATEHTHTRIISKTWHLSPLEFSLYYANNYFQAKVIFFFFSETLDCLFPHWISKGFSSNLIAFPASILPWLCTQL